MNRTLRRFEKTLYTYIFYLKFKQLKILNKAALLKLTILEITCNSLTRQYFQNTNLFK